MVFLDKVKAIIHPHFPGQESGNSLADVVFGDVNPSGRLPYTIAKKLEDYPALTTWKDQLANVTRTPYSEGNYIDYRYYEKKGVEPLFSFGQGLSNTEGNGNVDVKKSGAVAGWEVAQLYLGFPAVADQPIKQLRSRISSGNSKSFSFDLQFDELSY
ncbi:glycoside hydrolase family 3 C-terminal domain-containing protein [Zopfochytrium polystomum]|nr:glycoside hydrolase family 3 C-terminal domain-containing protein [Zopfochytrium polystomum]